MARKILIIGGGIAGLAAGCYGRMNGYETEIFEMHTVPGGVCTGWVRKGYTIDGCLHFLVGTGEGNSFHRVWDELGVLSGRRIIDHEVFADLVLPDGRKIVQHADVDRLVAGLKAIGVDRHDAAALDRLAEDAKLWGGFRMPLRSPGTSGSKLSRPSRLFSRLRGMWKIRAYLPLFKRFGGSIEDLGTRFHNPAIRAFFGLVVPLPGAPAMIVLNMLSVLHRKEAGWPEGGSLGLARSIAQRYEELGGVIRCGARVEEIIVREGRAVGVRLADGSEHFADEVISAADGHATLFGMLKGRYMTPALQAAYRTLPLYTPFVQVSFGVKRGMSDPAIPRLTTVGFATPVMIGATPVPCLLLNNYGFDSTLAPAGKSVLTVLYQSPWEIWEKLSGDRQAYLAEKARILEQVTGLLEGRFPGISADIEVTDVATPLTTVRYTGNYHASYEGWRPTASTMRTSLEKRLPGLAGFSMIGQWTTPAAGLPTAALDGRVAIQGLCAQDGKEFVTSVPDASPAQSALTA